MKWQDLNMFFKKQNRSRTLWIGTSGSVFAILAYIFLLTGVSYTYTGDSYVTNGSGEAYVNVTTAYWRICFADNFDFVSTTPTIDTRVYVPTYGTKWRLFDPARDCIDRGKVNRFKIIGKDITETTKWSFIADTSYINKIDIDPYWIVDGTFNNVTNETEFYHLSLNDMSLLLYLPMDYNLSTITRDYSSYSNDGQVINATLVSGKIGKAYDFNGNGQYIQINKTSYLDLNTTTGVTTSLWIKIDHLWTGTYYRIFEYYDSDYAKVPFSMVLHPDGDKMGCRFTSDLESGSLSSTTNSLSNDNQWHLLNCVYNTSHILLYIDGILNASKSILGTKLNTSSSPIYLSKRDNSYFNGSLDEVMLFNRSLSSTDINNLYNLQLSKFYSTGSIIYSNQSLGLGNNTLNITAQNCQTYLDSNITIKVNNEPERNFSDCNITYNSLNNFTNNDNITVYLYSNNSVYSPTIFNLSVDGYYIENLELSLSSGLSSILFKPNSSNATQIQPTGQTSSKGILNATNNMNVPLEFQMSINWTNYTKDKLLNPFYVPDNWNIYLTQKTNSTYNLTETCMLFNTLYSPITSTQPYSVGRVTYNFNQTRQFEYYNGSDYLKSNWTSGCPTENYIRFNLTNASLRNLSSYDFLEISYYPILNKTDTIKLSIENSTDQLNSSVAYLNTTNWTTLSFNISNLTYADYITLFVANSTSSIGQFYIDNLRLYNSGQEPINITVKAGCSNNYSVSKELSYYDTYTPLCNITNGSSQMIWMWQDYYNPKIGRSFDIFTEVKCQN